MKRKQEGVKSEPSKRAKETQREREKRIYWVTRMKAGRFSKGSLSLVPAVWGRDRDSKHWGQANADRTSAAALMASFSGTLIGPLMSLEKVVKAMKMESVPLCWHAIISLCVYLWITTFSPFLCAPRECPILPLHYSSYSLSFTVSPLSQSRSPLFSMLSCC